LKKNQDLNTFSIKPKPIKMVKLKTRTTLFVAVLAALFFQSCTMNRSYWVAPEFTSVSKISQLKSGMSTEEINLTLGMQPYDIFHIQQDGSSIIVYNYRIKERRMNVPLEPTQRERAIRNEERSQTDGEVWYQEDYNKVYVLLKDNKMKSLMTDHGYENSQFILLQNNTIQLISKSEMTNINNNKNESTSTSTTTNTSSSSGSGSAAGVIIPLKREAQKTNQNIVQQATESKGGKIAGVVATVAGIVLVVILASSL
jgi:hypothetical protein